LKGQHLKLVFKGSRREKEIELVEKKKPLNGGRGDRCVKVQRRWCGRFGSGRSTKKKEKQFCLWAEKAKAK